MATRGSVIAGHAYILIEALDKTQAIFRQITRRLDFMSQNLLFMGKQAMMLGTTLSIPLILATRSARDFSDEILYLQSVLRETDGGMEPLINKIKDLARTTSFTAVEIAQAATALAQGGFSNPQIRDSLQAVLNMARGARMELGPAADILVDTLTIFGMKASEANSVADKFFIAAKNGTIDVADLAMSFSYTGQSAAEMGFTLDETLGILSAMSLRMLKATKAGTSLNQFITSLASNLEKLHEELPTLEVFDAAGNPLPALKVLKQFNDLLNGMPAGTKIPLLEKVFNVRGMRTGMAITAGEAFQEIFNNIEEMRTGITDISKTLTKEELNSAMGLLAMAMNWFGESTDQTTVLLDKFLLASKQSSTPVQEFGVSLLYVADGAKEAGMNMDQTMGFLVDFQNQILKASGKSFYMTDALDKMKEAIVSLSQETGSPLPWKSLDTESPLKVLRDVFLQTQTMSEEDRNKVFERMFGFAGVGPELARSLGESFLEMISSMDGIATGFNAADEAAKQMDSGIGGSIRRILSSFNLLSIEVGLAMESMLKSFEETILPIIRGLTIWSKNNKEVFRDLVRIVMGVNAFGLSMMTMGIGLRVASISLRGLSNVISGLFVPFNLIKAVTLSTIGVVNTLVGSVVKLGLSFGQAAVAGLFGLARLLLKLRYVGDAIISVIGFSIQMGISLTQSVMAAYTAFMSLISAIITGAGPLIGFFIAMQPILLLFAAGVAVIGAVILAIQYLGDAFTEIGTAWGRVFGEIGKGIVGLVIELTRFGRSLPEIFLTALSAVTTYAKSMWEDVVSSFNAVWTDFYNAIQKGDLKTAFQMAILGLEAIWDLSLINLEIAWIKFSTKVQSVWLTVSDQIQASIDRIINGVTMGTQMIADMASTLTPDFIGKAVKSAASEISAAAKIYWNLGELGTRPTTTPEQQAAIDQLNQASQQRIQALEEERNKRKEALNSEVRDARELADYYEQAMGSIQGAKPEDTEEGIINKIKKMMGDLGKGTLDATKAAIDIPRAFEYLGTGSAEQEYKNKQTSLLSGIEAAAKRTADGVEKLERKPPVAIGAV